jgi:hypothetical protein
MRDVRLLPAILRRLVRPQANARVRDEDVEPGVPLLELVDERGYRSEADRIERHNFRAVVTRLLRKLYASAL